MSMLPASLHPCHRPARRRRRPRPITRPRPRPNPRTSWPAWTDSLVVSAVEPEDTRDHSRPFVPSAESVAWWTGFSLALAGEAADPLAHYEGRVRVQFVAGRRSGWLLTPEAREWFEAVRRADRNRDLHPCEAVEAVGAIAARTLA